MSARLRAVVAGLAAIGLLPCRLSGGPDEPARGKTAVQLRTDLSRMRARIREKKSAIWSVRRQERRITSEVETVEARLLYAESRLRAVQLRLRLIQRNRQRLTQRIAVTRRRLAAQRGCLATRVRESYEQGPIGYLHVLSQAGSLQEYVTTAYYVEKIVDRDVGLIRNIRKAEIQLRRDCDALEREAREQRALEAEFAQRRAAFRSGVHRKRDLLNQVRSTRHDLEEALDVLEDASRSIARRIRSLQRTPKGRARLLKPWTGRFGRPVDGPVTSNYGMRYHPILHRRRMHTGVDFGAPYGSSIRAAADGVVIMSSYMRGYGNTVIIDHGGGVTTLYAHCSALLVRDGRSVRQGQTIARVGSTGLATGPHLHFEVRHNGTPVNPR
ncbi:MAG: peptidoglycan DD-metalloendopeptidase family protein [Chthonomonadales bacterium]|nr:peptidoglycan DD-metalloendopeptidase family protein [Chthonomonadales bacterium]